MNTASCDRELISTNRACSPSLMMILRRLGENLGELPVQASSLLTRRRLFGAAAAAATVGLGNPVPAISYAPRSISLYNTHTGEWLRTVYWADGHYIREAVRDINWILREHYTDEMRPMNAGV